LKLFFFLFHFYPLIFRLSGEPRSGEAGSRFFAPAGLNIALAISGALCYSIIIVPAGAYPVRQHV
jgi:Cu/Ag efflux pump CusA